MVLDRAVRLPHSQVRGKQRNTGRLLVSWEGEREKSRKRGKGKGGVSNAEETEGGRRGGGGRCAGKGKNGLPIRIGV